MLKESRKIWVHIFIDHDFFGTFEIISLTNCASSCLHYDKSELTKKKSVDSYLDQKSKLNLFANIRLGKIQNRSFHLNRFWTDIFDIRIKICNFSKVTKS